MGNGVSGLNGPVELPDHIARIGLPRTMEFTWMHSWSQMVLHVSAPGSSTLYSANMPEGLAGPTILHPGPDVEASPMLYVEKSGRDFTFHLPGVPSFGLVPCPVVMRCERSNGESSYRFTMMVGDGTNDRRCESFEWRKTSGKELKSLGKSRKGWKLVRLGVNEGGEFLAQYPGQYGMGFGIPQQYGYGYQSQYSQEYYHYSPPQASGSSSRSGSSRDGKEAVAVFAEEKSYTTSMHKAGGFQYIGSGAHSDMGYHWALMAVMSGIVVFQHIKAKESNVSSSSG